VQTKEIASDKFHSPQVMFEKAVNLTLRTAGLGLNCSGSNKSSATNTHSVCWATIAAPRTLRVFAPASSAGTVGTPLAKQPSWQQRLSSWVPSRRQQKLKADCPLHLA